MRNQKNQMSETLLKQTMEARPALFNSRKKVGPLCGCIISVIESVCLFSVFFFCFHFTGDDNLALDESDGECGEDRDVSPSPSCGDYFMHFLTLFWKILFAFIPPTGNSCGNFYHQLNGDGADGLGVIYTDTSTMPDHLVEFIFISKESEKKYTKEYSFGHTHTHRVSSLRIISISQKLRFVKVNAGCFLCLFFFFFLLRFADIYGGYVCFVVSILAIGMVTAVIGDVASHFGCTLGIKDSVTAIVFVALGTSVPGSFHIISCFVLGFFGFAFFLG